MSEYYVQLKIKKELPLQSGDTVKFENQIDGLVGFMLVFDSQESLEAFEDAHGTGFIKVQKVDKQAY